MKSLLLFILPLLLLACNSQYETKRIWIPPIEAEASDCVQNCVIKRQQCMLDRHLDQSSFTSKCMSAYMSCYQSCGGNIVRQRTLVEEIW